MQELFGRILAGEIRKPSSFSIRTVKLMGQIDAPTAALFQRLSSMTLSIQLASGSFDARVVTLSGSSAAQNALAAYGFRFEQLNLLNEFGLIVAEYNSYMAYDLCIAHGGVVRLPFTFQKRQWGLVPGTERKPAQPLVQRVSRRERREGQRAAATSRDLIYLVFGRSPSGTDCANSV